MTTDNLAFINSHLDRIEVEELDNSEYLIRPMSLSPRVFANILSSYLVFRPQIKNVTKDGVIVVLEGNLNECEVSYA